jgi:hypothetical protein
MGPRPTWVVTWEILGDAGPSRFLHVQIDATRGEVMSFLARKEKPGQGGRLPAKVSREEAVALAKTQLPAPERWRITKVDARLGRTSSMRPLGYPIWDVALSCEEKVEGPDRAVMIWSSLVDGVTGELLDEAGKPLKEAGEDVPEPAGPPGTRPEGGAGEQAQ